ncbi:MAG: fatty acid desaturase, partial [Candidatus Methylomirabilis sp.]|nr:fatty acid desaturase [Deltaproteobacteria bacterium]
MASKAGFRETAGVWLGYGWMYYMPLATLLFLATAPHPWWIALPCIFLGAPLEWVDARRLRAKASAPETAAPWVFDLHLVVLGCIHLAAFGWLARNASAYGFWRADTFAGMMVVGGNAANAAIVVGHELIHRRGRAPRLFGRLLMASVFYEHFYTEHLRGHHARVGTPEDPATARFGESYRYFLRRTVPGQFRSAWRLETRRLGDEKMRLTDPRLLGSAVVHGLAAEALLALLCGLAWGPGALAVWVLAAGHAVVLLEVVNYMEHWGLRRTGRMPGPEDSWDTDSAGSVSALAGLARHAD